MKISRRSTLRLAAGAGLVGVTAGAAAPAAQAAYYNQPDTIGTIPDTQGCTGAQGFAAGATYLYSVKIRSDNARAVIYRTNKDTGVTQLMTNGTDGLAYNAWLGHANDMMISDIAGQHHLFIVTMSTTGAQLINLRYSGATYYKVASYYLRLNGAVAAVSGITRLSISATTLTFFFKSGSTVYRGSMPVNASSGSTINLTKAFTLTVAGALVNGQPVSDLTTFTNQGFYYHQSTQDLYYPLTKDNRSIILVYRHVTASSSGALTSDPNLSFRITSSGFPHLFEIEGLGISNHRLYFNANRMKTSTDGNYDAVLVFEGYTSA